MYSDAIIRVEGLGKKYIIGHKSRRERDGTLRDALVRMGKGFARTLKETAGGHPLVAGDTTEEFWALRDVSFEVKRGEVLGIIGRNGAGKSTLLKILSRITEPSEGRVTVNGRVASLLEVVTGFHPELSGRENILLNGAILGMTRGEIRRKFDEIVAFAGIERFLDTVVKRYSSGMYVRLAFAVAAHLEPEILIVDEVLAVGDAEFQKKCLGKMSEVSGHGRTVLFVSHDMRKITTLCNRGILLDGGRIEYEGAMPAVADTYVKMHVNTGSFADLSLRGDRTGSGDAQFASIELLSDGVPSRTFVVGKPFTQKIRVHVKDPFGPGVVHSHILTSDGIPVLEFYSNNSGNKWSAPPGVSEFTIDIERMMLYPGTYSINLWIGGTASVRVDYITEAISFNVIQTEESRVNHTMDRSEGLVHQPARWHWESCAGPSDAAREQAGIGA
jgi:lipopolysaccharide transport system ATP-binding protein